MIKWVEEFFTFCDHTIYPRQCWIGLSGGIDSVVLTHLWHQYALTRGFPSPQLIHIMHHDSTQSREMADFSKQLAHNLQLSLTLVPPPAHACHSESDMRQHRYHAFGQLPEKSQLLLGHHLDDQLETVLFNFIRGSGLQALSGMPEQRTHENVLIIRPLLKIGRNQIIAYAKEKNLDFFHDKSNDDLQYSRNCIRHKLLPIIEQHFPQYRQGCKTSLSHWHQANAYLQQHIDELYCSHSRSQWLGFPKSCTTWMRGELIKRWLHEHTSKNISQGHITGCIALLNKPYGTYHLGSYTVYSYQQMLYIQPSPLPSPKIHVKNASPELTIHRDLPHKTLIDIGKKCRIQLKKFFQQISCPPWVRTYVPLIFYKGRCISIPYYFHDEDYDHIISKLKITPSLAYLTASEHLLLRQSILCQPSLQCSKH